MVDLPSWVILSLREPLSAEELIRRARALGVHADATRDGIHLWGEFLAHLGGGRLEPRQLDRSLADAPIEMGTAMLHISGGTNEVERMVHQQPAAARKVAKEMAAKMAALRGLEDSGRIESSASRKVTSLTKLVRALAPLANAVIMPRANHIVQTVDQFIELSEPFVDGHSYAFPIWAFLKVREDEDGETVASTGMWVFGLPDVGMAVPPGLERNDCVTAVGELQREMVAEGWWPEDGDVFSTKLGDVRIARFGETLWLEATAVEATKAARNRFGRLAQLRQILGPHTHHHDPASKAGIAIEHFIAPEGRSLAITNGVSDRAQPGSSAGDENDFLEISLTSPDLGPWATGWLLWASQYLTMHDGANPIRPFDRLVLQAPSNGIHGAIVWPNGHLNPLRSGAPTVQLWDLIPFTPAELASFRAQPGAQGAWIDERLARSDFGAIQARWAPPR